MTLKPNSEHPTLDIGRGAGVWGVGGGVPQLVWTLRDPYLRAYHIGHIYVGKSAGTSRNEGTAASFTLGLGGAF